MERGRQKRSGSYAARRRKRDWKRPMLDRDQLLSPTCLVDSQIIARETSVARECAPITLSVHSGEMAPLGISRRDENCYQTRDL